MNDRERFEAAVKDDYDLSRDSDGNYRHRDAADAFWGFTAALASDPRRSVENMEDAIAALPATGELAAKRHGLSAKRAYLVSCHAIRWCLDNTVRNDICDHAVDSGMIARLREPSDRET